MALSSIGDPMAAKAAFLIGQLPGAGAKLSGTMIRCFHEHEPVWLLNANWPRSVPAVSMLWSPQLAGEMSVLPPWAGTMTSEHLCRTPQPRNWFSATVRIWTSSWPLPFAAVVAYAVFIGPNGPNAP